jgi:hypothetical protein
MAYNLFFIIVAFMFILESQRFSWRSKVTGLV